MRWQPTIQGHKLAHSTKSVPGPMRLRARTMSETQWWSVAEALASGETAWKVKAIALPEGGPPHNSGLSLTRRETSWSPTLDVPRPVTIATTDG